MNDLALQGIETAKVTIFGPAGSFANPTVRAQRKPKCVQPQLELWGLVTSRKREEVSVRGEQYSVVNKH